MNQALIASRRHLAIVLIIIAALTLAGIAQSASAGASPAGETPSPASRLVPYLVLIGLQILWVRYVRGGMRAHGHALGELTGGRPAPRELLFDVAAGALGMVVARALAAGLAASMDQYHANTAFLLPHGAAEAVLWVAVSVTAGTCEEIIFRGYLQRQFTALTGSVAGGVLLQTVAFGISHGYQGFQSMAVTGAYGLVLGLLAWWRGNIRAAALAHAATDIVGGLGGG